MTAILSRVAETTTGTGTGNLTLAGAATSLYGPNVRGFNAAAGNGATGFLFYYSILHQSLEEWEDGVGYMLDASTLVRHKVLRSNNGNNAVNFSAGVKVVVATNQGDARPLWGGGPFASGVNRYLIPVNYGNGSTTQAMIANRVYCAPIDFDSEQVIAEWVMTVTTAAASSFIRAAIVERTAYKEVKVIADLGFIDGGTTGTKVFPAGLNLTIPAGRYYFLTHSNGAPVVRSFSGASYPSQTGQDFFTGFLFLIGDLAAGTPANAAWPSTLSLTTGAINNAPIPALHYRDATRFYI